MTVDLDDARRRSGEAIDLRGQGAKIVDAATRLVKGLLGVEQEAEAVDPTEWMLSGLAEGQLGLDTESVGRLISDGRLTSRRIGERVFVLRSDVEREAKARTVAMRSVVEGSAARVESSDDAGPRSAPIVVEPSPRQPETIIEKAVMRG
jgi:hypothetical protein